MPRKASSKKDKEIINEVAEKAEISAEATEIADNASADAEVTMSAETETTPTPKSKTHRTSKAHKEGSKENTKHSAAPKKKIKIETSSYKGVRDFYPTDMFLEKYIFKQMRKTVESFGYVEYGASILEPAELYRAKTGEEIVNEQTYTFVDRGGREVTLRPEMTPTVARMVAARRRELSFPLRWYSIPNLFRYEQPQKGRIREHFQLNVDIFGLENERAEIEIVSLAYQLMKDYGAKDSDFEIRISDRNILNFFWDSLSIPEPKRHTLSKIIDKKEKISKEAFAEAIKAETGKKADAIVAALESGHAFVNAIGENNEVSKRLVSVVDGLTKLGVTNVVFTPTLVRGLDYYSGFVFEIFDTNPENSRSLFGGGRYDRLLEIFESEKVPAVGFGAGDVTLADFLQTRKLVPEYRPPTLVYLAVLDNEYDFADVVAEKMRDQGISVAVDYTEKGIGDRIKKATNDRIPFFAVIGSAEAKGGSIKIKKLSTRAEKTFTIDENGMNDFVTYLSDDIKEAAEKSMS